MSRRFKLWLITLFSLSLAALSVYHVVLWHVQNPLKLRIVDLQRHPEGAQIVFYEVKNDSWGPVHILELELFHESTYVPGTPGPRFRTSDAADSYLKTLKGGETWAGKMYAYPEVRLRGGRCLFLGQWEPTSQMRYKQMYHWIGERLLDRMPDAWWDYLPKYPQRGRRFRSVPLNLPIEGPLAGEWRQTERIVVPSRSRP